MKKILLFYFFIALNLCLKAQPFGNEWIDPTRTHYKIQVSNDGIYRVSYSALNNVIPNFGSVKAKTLILYHNGEAVPIYVSVPPDSSLKQSDYIEFYGKKNRGEMDSLLYRAAYDQINPTFSLFTNTSVYYLTTNNLPNNPRLNFTANALSNLPPKEDYFMYLWQVNYPNGMYYPGKYYSVGITETYKSVYDVGEGYTDNSYFNYIFTNPTPALYTQGPSTAIFRTIYANNSAFEEHKVAVLINNVQAYPTPPSTQNANGFQLNHVEVNIPITQLNSGNNSVQYVDYGNGVSTRKNVVGALSIEYPRYFDFGGGNQFYFQIDASNSNKYLEITNFDASGTQPLLYDFTNGLIYRSVQPTGSTPLKYNLLPSQQKREMFLRADNANAYTEVNSLTPVNFVDYSSVQNQGEYFIISNSALFDDGTASHTNWVEEYRKYRDNQFQQARIVDVDLLYDQFGYGIRKSPLGVRNFINYMSKDASIAIKLKYAFIIGKAREAPDLRNNSGPAWDTCFVPTFGYPGSDNLLAASRESDIPCAAIGRLAVKYPHQIRDYLNKIKLYEEPQNSYVCAQDIPSKAWQKEILHFSGGTTGSEQLMFRYFLDTYRLTAEDSLWGAHVTSFSKTSNNPIDVSVSQAIKNKINDGVSWITFFGHSATGAFDFSIDEPENYENSPRFPIILSNGCFSGFIHDVGAGYSERFVLTPDKGAIAFMATSNLSVSSGLNNFSSQLYKSTCVREYNQPLGKAIQNALTVLFQNPIDDYSAGIAYEMTLHGDPGLKPNQYPKPDYAIDASSVYTTPLTVSPGMDSFDVNIIITNLGKCSVDDTLPTGKVVKSKINVSLKRTVFDAANNPVYYYYNKDVRAPFFKDTIAFKIPVNISTLGYGQNLFEPTIDATSVIDEMAECNNSLTAPFSTFIQSDDIIPIYPYEFAIVPTQGVTLKASTVNPFAPMRPYRFQIDTSELFAVTSSTQFRDTVINQVGGVVHWAPVNSTFTFKDSTVYYWRVKWDSAGAQWHYSSFIYLKDEYPGWNQSHYFQYKKDAYEYVNLDTDRVFKFPNSLNQIHVRTGKANAVGGNVDYATLGWDYNNSNEYRFRMGGCGYFGGGLTFAVIDSLSGKPWESVNQNNDNFGDQFFNVHCASHSTNQRGFDFPTTGNNAGNGLTWAQTISNFINAIPDGSFVLMYSVNNPPYTSWSPTLINALGQLGFVSQPFTSGAVNGQLVFFTQKGNINYSPFYANSNGLTSILDTTFTFFGKWFQGGFTTPKIGPAVEWRSVHWRKHLEWQTQASNLDSVDIIGVNTSGNETVLFTTTKPDNLFYNGGPVIDAQQYPYLKLRLRTFDAAQRTPAQLYYWRVLYKKPPEAAINPAAHFVPPNVVNIGARLHFEIGLENVTDIAMPDMLTKYTIRDAALNTYNYYIRYDTLYGFAVMHLVFDTLINQNSYLGLNKIIIEANPDNDQLEQYHFNNIAEFNFTAVGDKINPLLDVTFDNQHIMSGDIVSAKPNILITLRDENKYLPLNDTSLIQVYLKYPGDVVPRRMSFDDITMKFYPADSNTLSAGNKAQVELKPVFTVDGTYELLIKDRDKSGNNSATTDSRYQGNNPATFFDYKIAFEVITKPMVTNVLNYPNPFTSSTRFVFTITGSEVPDFMKIQIITIKGTVVKEIFKDELGPLHIGRNITEYAWDGRDQYGDLLANGIYFYHVVTRLDDKQMDQMGMSYDKYFKKGFGKMAIIR